MAKVLESLIAKGRRARRPPEQKEVAFGLADLSTHEELLERLVQKGGVKTLLILLTKSIDADAQRFSALAMGNAASAAFNRTRIASEGAIPVLVEFMKNSENDIVARQYCAMALGNLAAEPENHMEIVKSDGIDALIAVLRSEDVEGGRYAAFALSNLAANANHRERIVEENAVPALVALACSEDINAQRQAMAALRGLCISPEYRAVVVREGILDPLVLMSRSEEISVLREVAASLNNLSSIEENKLEISDRAMCTIIGLMLSGDMIVERHAVCCAANLMETLELNSRLVEERGVAPLVALASNQDANSRGEACRCLANLSLNPDVHQVLIREGALAALVASLSSPELNCQRYASLSIANLATTVAAQVKIIQSGAVRPLINLALNPLNQIEARRYAVLALANLTATTANHMTIIEDNGIPALLSLCNSPDLMSQYYVGCALANLSCSFTNHAILIEAGGVQAMIALASSADPDVHQQAAAALRGLSVTFSNKMKIVQEGALTPLSHLLASDDVEILREVVACLSNLSVCDENKYEIVKAGTLPALISLSQSSDMLVASQSCATLANLAEFTVNQDAISQEGAIRPTITVMRSKYIEVQREAGRLLANLCASESDFTQLIIEGGGHNLLISYLLSNDTACQRVGALGICNLCTQKRYRGILIECGVLEPLCSLARSEDVELEIQRYAVLAIANLASATENHKTFVADGMLSMLISLSTANDAEVRQYAAYACVKISQNAEVRNAITEAGGLEPVLYLARTDEPEIQRQVLPALCCLSFHDSNKVPIVRYGGLEPIVRSVRDGTTDNARLACCCLANLAEMAVNFDLIHDSGAIPNLVWVLSSPSEEVKRESARALGNLAANIELGDVILREGALPYLIPMLRSPDYLTQRMASMALCNLTSNVRNQSYMLNGGLFDPLLHETKLSLDPKSKSDHECTRYCLLTLANLAVNPVNQRLIMSQALETLSAFSKHRDVKCRQHAVFCLGNLCSSMENLEEIMSFGVLRTLITYAFPSSDSSNNVQFQAVAALRGLATHPILRVQIVREGALEPLIMAAKAPSIEVQREAAAAICNLAVSEENKVILARSGVLPVLVALAGGSGNDEQRELHAVCALANIAEMVEGRTQEKMIEEGVMKILVRLSDSQNVEIRQQVARNFALFASKRDSHSTLVRIHAATKMLNFMCDADEVVQRYGVLGLGNLAVSRESHQELFDVGAVATLMDLTQRAKDLLTRRAIAFTLNNIACNPANHVPCERLGLTRSLLSLLSDNEKDVNLQVVLATRHLCESAKFRNQFIEMQGIPALLPLGYSEDIEIKREVCAALRNLSLSVHGKVVMVRERVLALLCECMQSPDVEVCHQSTGVVANLAESSENQGYMVEQGAIQHLKYVLRSKSIDVQREAARALANISAEYTYAPAIVSAGTLQSLIAALGSPDYLCQRYACMGIGNLSTHPNNMKKVIQEGALPMLIALAEFTNGDLESQRYAAVALTNLSANKANHSVMIQTNCLILFRNFLGHQDVEIRNTSIFALANMSSNPNNHQLIVKEGCLPLIIDMLNTPDLQAQYRAVCALRGLSTDYQIRLDMVQCGAIPLLLPLAKSEDVNLQMECLACLCNLSLCGCIGQSPLNFLDVLTVQQLVTFLCSADNTFRLFGAVALGNIASNVSLQDGIIQSGALVPLISLSSQSDLETQRCISYALVNMAADPLRRSDIVREGGLVSLLSLACSDDLQDEYVALVAIRGILSQAENRRAVYKASVNEALSLGTKANHLDIRCEVAAIFNALSINDENKLEMAAEDQAILNLIDLLSSNEDFRILRPAMACLANLTERSECHPFLRRHSVHNLVLNYAQSDDIGLVREMARCLANLAAIHENQPPIVSGGGIHALLLACNHPSRDALITRFAVLGLLNLATLPDNHPDLISTNGTIDSLVCVAEGEERVWKQLDLLGEPIPDDATANAGMTESSDPQSQNGALFVQQNKFDLEARRYATLAIGNVAISFSTHLYLANQKCVQALNSTLTLPDPESRFNGAFALNKLAINHQNIRFIGEMGVIPNLINLVAIPQEFEAKGQALSCLRHLSYNIDNRMLMLEGQLLGPLGILSNETEDLEILREVCALTTQLTLSDSLRYPICGNSQLLSVIAKLMSHSDVEIARFACATIANIGEAKRAHKSLAAVANAVHLLIFLMRSKHVSISREAARAMSNLLTSKASHRLFLDDSGLMSLFRLCRSLDEETLHHCAIMFRKLSPMTSNHEYIVSKGGLAPLLLLVSHSRLDIRLQAAAAMRDLASNLNFKTVIAEEGGLKKAIQLAEDDSSLELRILGLGILRHLSINSRIKRPIIMEGGLSALFKAAEDESQDVDLLCQTAALFSTLAENGENQITLIRDNALPRMVHLARVNHPEVQQDVAKAFALLTSNSDNQIDVFGSEEILAMLHLCGSVDENCLRDALIALGNLAVHGKNQYLIFHLGALPIVTKAVQSEFESCKRYACRLLYRLAAHADIQDAIVQPRLIASLVELLGSTSTSSSFLIRKFALMVLCNLSCSDGNKLRLANLGVIGPIISNLRHDEEVVSRYAAMALTNLATEPANQLTIAKLGGIAELILLASKDGLEGSRYAGMSLANLATNRSNRSAIVDSMGLIPLVKMAFAKNVETQRAAGLALYNISCAVINHIPMVKADVIPALANLGKSDDLECKTFAIMSMANLAANKETRVQGTRGGALQTAIVLLKDADLNIRRYAAIALCNMGNNSTTQEQIVVHGALPSVLQMAMGAEQVAGLAASKFSLKFDVAAGMSSTATLDGGGGSGGGSPSDVETQRLALLTLSNLASNEINHSAMVNKGFLKICTTAFQSSDEDLRNFAAFGVANLCSNPDYLALVGRQGGIPLLIHLSKSNNANTLSLGLAALRRLSNQEENWPLLIGAGVLDSLASAGKSQYTEVQREVAATLCSLSLSKNTQHRMEIAYKCLPALVRLASVAEQVHTSASAENDADRSSAIMRNVLVDIARQAIGAMANLAEEVDTHEFIAKAQASKAFIALESFHSIDIQREATRAIANLLSSFRHQSSVIEEGIPGLVALSYSDDLEACYHSALSFRKLGPNVKSHSVIVYSGGFKALFRLVTMPHLLIQMQAAAALRDLVANPEFQLACAEDGGIAILVGLLRQSDEYLVALALSSLRHLSAHPLLKHPIIQERALRPILKTIGLNIEDIQLQCAGTLANLSELLENQVTIVEESGCIGLLTLAFAKNDEIQQDTARALANLASNEETHVSLYKQGAVTALTHLTSSTNEITQKYAAMGLRFLAADPQVRILMVENKQIDVFLQCAKPDNSLEYRRTAAAGFASFTLHERNKALLIQTGAVQAILGLLIQDDLAIQRDAAFALANLTDSPELQADLVREGILLVLRDMASKHTDVRVQRDMARCYANLAQTEDVRQQILNGHSLPAILNLAKSMDSASQRYATLTLCNLCSSQLKGTLLEQGIMRPLIFLMHFPDPEIQRYASLALAGVALGTKSLSKVQIVQEGAMKPLIDLIKFPDENVQLSACLAVNSLVLGTDLLPKASVMTEGGVEALLNILERDHLRRDVLHSAVYCLGSICEHEDVKIRFVESRGIELVVRHLASGDMEMKRAAGYCLATISEQVEYHGDLVRENALPAILSLANLEDLEAQEYAAFTIAHLASNRDLQVTLVQMGVVRPLVTMLSSDAEPKHYAGLALLKLADNFENHLRIAEEGGIQALLRLGRTRTTDDQLQYKAALTLGQLATNAVKLLPSTQQAQMPAAPAGGVSASIAALSHVTMDQLSGDAAAQTQAALGLTAKVASSALKAAAVGDGGTTVAGSRMTERLRAQIAAQKEQARADTLQFLDQKLGGNEATATMRSTGPLRASATAMSRSLDFQGGSNVASPSPFTPVAMRRTATSEATPLHPVFRMPSSSAQFQATDNLLATSDLTGTNQNSAPARAVENGNANTGKLK